MKEATLLFQWAELHLLSIKVEQHRGGLAELQKDRRGEVELHKYPQRSTSMQSDYEVMGRPEMDLFASPNNTQVPVFLSQTPTPPALDVDALCYLWPQVLLYAFPPLPFIQAVLQQAKWFRARLILVAPNWPRRPWYPTVINMSVGLSIRLPTRLDLLRHGPLLHPNPSIFRLTAWLLNSETW